MIRRVLTNHGKLRYQDADRPLDVLVVVPAADLIRDHPAQVIDDALAYFRNIVELDLNVDARAAGAPDPDIKDALLAFGALAGKRWVDETHFSVVFRGQVEHGLQESDQRPGVPFVPENPLEHRVVAGVVERFCCHWL